MKVLKNVLFIISDILLIPTITILVLGGLIYILPNIRTTELGLFLINNLTMNVINWILIGALILFAVLFIIQCITEKSIKVKLKNFFIHLITWFTCLLIVGLVIYTFIYTNPLISGEVIITNFRKISMGIIIGLLIFFYIFSNKLLIIINRRIQAYETAKESNIVGRSSVVFTNILKLIEILFPEILILLLICLCTSWNIASYFTFILISTIIPLFGNIKCDINIRNDIKYKQEKEKDLMAEKVAENLRNINSNNRRR